MANKNSKIFICVISDYVEL